MDWRLSESEAAAPGSGGMTSFMARLQRQLRSGGAPIEGFSFLSDAREMLRISREIEAEWVSGPAPSAVYVGFQNDAKFELETDRYREIKRRGVSVYAFGEGNPQSVENGATAWFSLPRDRRNLENQWYLVARAPQPVAFVGWEVSDDSLWGRHGATHPDKRFAGFVSQDPRVVLAITSHLDIVRASSRPGSNSGEASRDGTLRELLSGTAPRRLGLLVDDGKRPAVNRVLNSVVNAGPIPNCDLYLYDLASASYLVDPYPRSDDRRPLDAAYVRAAIGRPYLADRMEQIHADGSVFGILPTGVGFSDLGEWSNRLGLDAVVIPGEYEHAGLMDRLRGYTLDALRSATGASVLISHPVGAPRLLRGLGPVRTV